MCNGKAISKGTDNFEFATFVWNGVTYHSAEQFYQALKMKKAADQAKVVRCVPKSGEKSWDHGMRVWQAGQLGAAHQDWEAIKVDAMYFANKVKLQQNPEILAPLLESNGLPQGPITHKGSGKFWDTWNPILLMLLREELSPAGGDPQVIEELRGKITSYRLARSGRDFIAELEAAGPLTEGAAAAASVEPSTGAAVVETSAEALTHAASSEAVLAA